MEGVQSYEQRSADFDGSRGNRVIIVNRREPSLRWLNTSDGRHSKATLACCSGSSFSSLFRSCRACKCGCGSGGGGHTTEKSLSRGRAKRKASDFSSGSLAQNTTLTSESLILDANSFDYGPFSSNEWKTSKYTLLNFLPKNLFEQFRRLANFYFLVGAIIQIIIPYSPVGPATSLIPLVFVVSTTAIKQAYEDFLRHKLDNEVNNRICYVLRGEPSCDALVRTCSKDIRVGDIVYVKNNEEIPCDMILLASSGAGDRCYITTANLDGETSLKNRSCFQFRQQVGSIDKINESMLVVECEKPNATLYEFNGFLRAPKDAGAYERLVKDFRSQAVEVDNTSKPATTGELTSQMDVKRVSIVGSIFKRLKRTQIRSRQTITKHLTQEQLKQLNATDRLVDNSSEHIEIPLDISNLLLRASRLRNTSFIYGLAVYTGEDTRLAHNSHVKPNKLSSLEGRVNMFLAIAFVILMSMTLISAVKHWWSIADEEDQKMSLLQVITAHFVLYNYLVPISLYVTLEFVKFLGTIAVLDDKKLQAQIWTSVSDENSTSTAASNQHAGINAKSLQVQPVQSGGPNSRPKKIQVRAGPQCNSSDLNEDLGQVEVLFSDKTGTLTENKMHFMACSIYGHLYRSISGQLYEQPDGLCHMPTLNVAHKLARVSTNRYASIANELAQNHGPRSALPERRSSVSSRSSKSSFNRLAKLPPHQRPFDHRLVPPLGELKLVSSELDQHASVVEFFICLCLCSTISINEQVPLEECLHESNIEQFDYQSASPDEESLISAAAQFGIIICKSSERECYIAIKRKSSSSPGRGKKEQSPSQKSTGGQQLEEAARVAALKDHTKSPLKETKSQAPPPQETRKIGGEFRAYQETKHSNEKYVVRQFERLLTFEFNSVRKRMSVLCRDCDSNCNVLFTKGSESVLDSIGMAQENRESSEPSRRSINSILTHFEAFSKSGLRTMLVARRLVEQQEYDAIVSDIREARLMSSHDGRESRLSAIYKQVESEMSLVGSTAVEDSLQEGVPETIAELKEAGIKVWLLTGDKVETAISVAYLCKLLDCNMNLLQLVRQQDTISCKQLLESYIKRVQAALQYGDEDDTTGELELATTVTAQPESVSKRPKSQVTLKSQVPLTRPAKVVSSVGGSSSGSTTSLHHHHRHHSKIIQRSISFQANDQDLPRFALIADGRSLHYAMKYAKQQLEYICENCVCVLGCRLSPLQKAEIVEMVKSGESEPIVAAIGDGANDVSMIQEAHVGIGISGKEGRQAVNSSDFAINRFYMLNRLLFVHGHLFYHRTANTILYFFYKNILFTVPQFLYTFYHNSSATSLYHPTMLVGFNMIFTSIPILLYGLFEVSIQEHLLETYPRLYRVNKRNEKMRYSVFFSWLIMGTLQATIGFYFVYFIWASDDPFREINGSRSRIIGFSLILFNTIVLVATMKLYFISKNRSYKFDLASILSCISLPIAFYILSLFDLSHLFRDNSLYGQFSALVQSPVYWLSIAATTAAVIVPDIIVYVYQQISYYRKLNSVIGSWIVVFGLNMGLLAGYATGTTVASLVVMASGLRGDRVELTSTLSSSSGAATKVLPPSFTKASKIADKPKQESSQPRRSKKRQKQHGGREKEKEKEREKDKDKDKEESSINGKGAPTFQEIIGQMVASKFKLIKLLGSGSYGAVYLGKNAVTSEMVAVKLEHKATKAPQLPLEYRFIKMIGPVEGFPRIIRIDDCAGIYHAMVMELLGPSLEEVFNACDRKMSLKSVLYLSLQLLTRFQTLHSKNIIYRDVKPENFLLGRPGMEKENIVHIIDYGLAKEYINPETGTHITFRGQRGAIGTARYMSVNTHMGKEQSRRDDLEALGYVIIYLMRGSLPWQGLPATDHRERMRKIGEMKRRLPVEEICERCPDEFASYLRYVKHLDFYEAPDYDYLKKLFFDLFVLNHYVDDGQYDWTGKFESSKTA